jgi:uncharacterized membrane protein
VRRPLPKKVLPSSQFNRESTEFDRSLGFFDATYAFALTLLILNIDLPPESAWQSVSTLLGAVSWQLIGFITSFIVIIIFWLSNSGIISRLKTLDQGTILLNIVVLGLIVFIPFTTQAISDPGLTDLALPTVVYAINVTAAIVVQSIMYERAISKGFGRFPVSPRTRMLERIDSAGNPFVFLLSIPIALAFGGVAGKLTWLLMIPLGIITGRMAAKAELADLEAAGITGPDSVDAAAPDAASAS